MTKTSPSALTLDQLGARVPKLTNAPAASCLTGEMTRDPHAKFNVLFRTYTRLTTGDLAGLPEAPTLTTSVVRSLKLLVEMHGSVLTASEREQALVVYTHPAVPACTAEGEHGLDATPATSTCSDVPPGVAVPASKESIDRALTFCQRLTLDHVSSAEAAVALPRCLQLATDVRSREAAHCDVSAYVAPVAKTLAAVTSKANADPVTQNALARPANIRMRLARIEQFYSALKPLFATQPADVWPFVSVATAGFWHGLYAPARAAVNSDSPVVVQTFATAADGVDQDVLLAAFPPAGTEAPLSSAPLLYLVGDALQPLVARLDDVGLLHDAACRFSDCPHGTLESRGTSTVTATWNALAHIDEQGALTNTLTRWTLPGDWKAPLHALANRYGVFKHAIADAYGDAAAAPARLVTDAIGQLPPAAISLAHVMATARQRDRDYANTGLFDPGALDGLVTGLQRSKQLAAVEDVKFHVGKLSTHRGEYELHRSRAVQDAMTGMGLVAAKQRAMTNLAMKQQEVVEAASRLEGYRYNAAVDALAFADYGKQFQRMLDDDTESAQLRVVRPTITLPTLQQSHAKYRSAAPHTLGQMAVTFDGNAPWKLAANAGDILNVEVSGTWSPTCALSQTAPWQGHIDAAAVHVGPEGFSVQQQGSSFSAHSASVSHDESGSTRSSASARACAGVSYTTGIWGDTSGVKASVSVEGCLSTEIGTSTTDSEARNESNGTEVRQQTSFTTGLRLPTTPFPSLPAGSLLLVGATPGAGGAIQMVRVLQAPHLTIPVGTALEFSLVVNDVASCGNDLSTNGSGLTVSLTQLQPAGVRGVALGRAMATTLAKLRQRAADVVEQGELLPGESESLTAQALEICAPRARANRRRIHRIIRAFTMRGSPTKSFACSVSWPYAARSSCFSNWRPKSKATPMT